MWPASSPVALVRRLYGRGAASGATGASGALDGGELALALRMIRRRSRDGRSFTVLGDLAQATAPGATGDWALAIAALGEPSGASVDPLTVGYRVPAPIMDVANAYLAAVAPHVEPTRSVRAHGEPPHVVRADGELSGALAPLASSLLSSLQTVAAIGPAPLLEGLDQLLLERGVRRSARGGLPARATDPCEGRGGEGPRVRRRGRAGAGGLRRAGRRPRSPLHRHDASGPTPHRAVPGRPPSGVSRGGLSRQRLLANRCQRPPVGTTGVDGVEGAERPTALLTVTLNV